MLVAFEAKARAADNDRRRSLWLAHETASLHRFAVHAPNKMPTLASLLGETPKAQTGEERRSLMKALAAKTGGEVKTRTGFAGRHQEAP